MTAVLCQSAYVLIPSSSKVSSEVFDHKKVLRQIAPMISYLETGLGWSEVSYHPKTEQNVNAAYIAVCDQIARVVSRIQLEMLPLYKELENLVEESCDSITAKADLEKLRAINEKLRTSDLHEYVHPAIVIGSRVIGPDEFIDVCLKRDATLAKVKKCIEILDHIWTGVNFSESGEVSTWSLIYPFSRTEIISVKKHSLQSLCSMKFDEFSAVWERMSWCGKAICL